MFDEIRKYMNERDTRGNWLNVQPPDALWMLETLLSWQDNHVVVPESHIHYLRGVVANAPYITY